MLLTPLEFIGQSTLLSPDKLLKLNFELVSGNQLIHYNFLIMLWLKLVI